MTRAQKADTTRPSKIERLNPALMPLVEAIGGGASIYYRAFAYWLGPWDLQLTYDRRGATVLDDAGKAQLAEEILRGVLAAREQPRWGTVRERALRVLAGLRDEALPNFRRGHYCYWRDESQDRGCAWSSPYGLRFDLSLDLIGEERVEVETHDGPPAAAMRLAAEIDRRWP